MPRRPPSPAPFVLALLLAGCGSDPRAEAPTLATAAAIAQAAPNAIGPGVDRPVAAAPAPTKTSPSGAAVPSPKAAKPRPDIEPADPLAPIPLPTGGAPQKGTHL